MNQFVSVTSTNAAKIFNLYPQKGVIAPGSDADIVVIDSQLERTISAKTGYQASGFNIWEGWIVKGITIMTISAGQIVWEANVENGKVHWEKGIFNAPKGRGRYLKRDPFGNTAYDGLLPVTHSPISR